MPNLTLIYPRIGGRPGRDYVRSWQMEPLSIAALAAHTPPEWKIAFFDDRLEDVDYDRPADLVGISIDTYTARRGYEIAGKFRERGVRVVMGGYHPTLCPDEAMEQADAICVGEAEPVWRQILLDAAAGRLARRYDGKQNDLSDVRFDRSIFVGKSYYPLALVEAGRGCPFQCRFCSVSAFHHATYRRRPVDAVLGDLQSLRKRLVFFVDDNLVGNKAAARELFEAVTPLGLRWIGQASIDVARDPELLGAMVKSGCMGLLIGFESLDAGNLTLMGKSVNRLANYREAMARFRRAGILIYGSFVFGYPRDTPALFAETVRFARDERIFAAAFAHLVPFPGTPLYDDLKAGNRFRYDKWWLSDTFRFGDVPFNPQAMSAAELDARCHEARRTFYSWSSILGRAMDFKANCGTPTKAFQYLGANVLLRREISRKRGIPLGAEAGDPLG